MNLAPMRYKDYVWPHNPRVYEIDYKHLVKSHKLAEGSYSLQSLGLENRVLRGEGEFYGANAYDEFRELASVFYDETAGTLVHPIWQTSTAYFVELTLLQEPTEDYVSYAFEFWECSDVYSTDLEKVSSASTATTETSGETSNVDTEEWYTVVAGDTMWAIAVKYSIELSDLIALNPQIKNVNLIYSGDEIRVK